MHREETWNRGFSAPPLPNNSRASFWSCSVHEDYVERLDLCAAASKQNSLRRALVRLLVRPR
ncbi:hypothetical protein ADIAG_03986 [Paeniglutamicibacter gangotriensis Lz1y]|uniref:Uncharacterized protein n=1 Tax=Paeniglutamicibacter gangotriensis Lz1y TaxID=1276920 RepID=M7MNY8_9MICC|nr:hypothetical protein ADIAG_03986 [Paeniglutamicibacter gangotriensis Lz1y]